MSSNFLSRPVDVSKYAVIFVRLPFLYSRKILINPRQGGAQKNIGLVGITLVVIRKDILECFPPPAFLHAVGVWSSATVLEWNTIAKNNSLYNTISIPDVWMAGGVMRSLLSTHQAEKLAGQEKSANEKAQIIYDILDAHPAVYKVVPRKHVRSRMNICFRIREGDAASERAFLEGAEEQLLQGLKGHRSVGGIRASNYNAVSLAHVQRLAIYLVEYAERPKEA